MAGPRAYLDWNASAPLLAEARDAVVAALSVGANASSVHAQGREARRIVEGARRAVAGLVNARPQHVVFTSGATEAAATLLTPDYTMGRGPLRMSRLYVCAADHPCTLCGGRFPARAVSVFGVGHDGIADLAELERLLAGHDAAEGLPLVAVHMANNETGVIQPVGEISRIVKSAGGMLVVDAVQAAGRIPIDLSQGWADYLILSGHKTGAPAGVGALIAGSDLVMPKPLIVGGGQEKGHRAGTENLAGIAGFGAAAAIAAGSVGKAASIAALRDRIEKIILNEIPRAVIHGREAERICNTTCFSIPGMKAETAQIAFDLAGVSLSAGSACSSGRTGPSHVMAAMGVAAADSIRVSIGAATAESELELFAKALKQIAGRRKGEVHAA